MKKLDRQLLASLQWWLIFITTLTPRPAPTRLNALPVVVSYSDGEGGCAGIGAAVWMPGKRPLAVYTEVPDVVRKQWQTAQGAAEYRDIFQVEALGPLMRLVAYPKAFINCLWIHFIDNSAAEASLVRGASSSDLGDHVIGLTWSLIQKHHLWA